MSRLIMMSPLAFVLSLAIVEAQQWSTAEQEVWKQVENFYAAYRNGDVDGMVVLYHPNYVNWGYARPMPRDRSALKEALELWFKTGKNKTVMLEVKPVSIMVRDNTAVVCYYTTETYQDADGKMDTSSTRWMEVLVREGGKWLVFADHGGTVRLQ